MKDQIIVFYDGQCGLCNRLVNLFIGIDHKKRLKFSPLQGETAKTKLSNELLSSLNTTVFLKNNRLYTKSDAALEILYAIGGIFTLFYIFKLIPRFIRNYVYDFISKNRIRWFGQTESCRMSTIDEKSRFLD